MHKFSCFSTTKLIIQWLQWAKMGSIQQKVDFKNANHRQSSNNSLSLSGYTKLDYTSSIVEHVSTQKGEVRKVRDEQANYTMNVGACRVCIICSAWGRQLDKV